MYAVIQTCGKQYRVSPGDVIRVERLVGEKGGVLYLTAEGEAMAELPQIDPEALERARRGAYGNDDDDDE